MMTLLQNDKVQWGTLLQAEETRDLKGMMLSMRNWAVVGSHGVNPVCFRINNKLLSARKRVFRVNPSPYQTDTYQSLFPIRNEIDIVVLCINPLKGIQVVEEMGQLGIRMLWIQPGASSPAIISAAKKYGMMVHEGCVMVEGNW